MAPGLSTTAVTKMIPTIQKMLRRLGDVLEKHFNDHSNKINDESRSNLIQAYTLDVISNVLFGLDMKSTFEASNIANDFKGLFPGFTRRLTSVVPLWK
jgi:hypothetical protein